MKEAYVLAQMINGFYQEAFSNALVVVGIVFGVVGVVVPLVMAFLQAKHAAADLQQLKLQISSEVSLAVQSALEGERLQMKEEQASALATFQVRSDKVVSDLQAEVGRKIAQIRGGAFHVQAVSLANAGRHTEAVKSACDAIHEFVNGQDYSNLRAVCVGFAISFFPKVRKEDLGSSRSDFLQSCELAISSMEAVNEKGEFSDLVRDLKHALAEFNARSKVDEIVDVS